MKDRDSTTPLHVAAAAGNSKVREKIRRLCAISQDIDIFVDCKHVVATRRSSGSKEQKWYVVNTGCQPFRTHFAVFQAKPL